jgi:hypothetical protein
MEPEQNFANAWTSSCVERPHPSVDCGERSGLACPMPGGRVVVAELECDRCGAVHYSAVAVRRPDRTDDCPCGGQRTVVRHIEDRRRHDLPVPEERRAPAS